MRDRLSGLNPFGTDGPPGYGPLADITHRVLDLLGENPTPVSDGAWARVQSSATRKEWRLDDHRVVLETNLKPGGGWRVYAENTGTNRVVAPATVPGARPQIWPDAELDTFSPEGGDEPPRYTRATAFHLAERLMSQHGDGGGGTAGRGHTTFTGP